MLNVYTYRALGFIVQRCHKTACKLIIRIGARKRTYRVDAGCWSSGLGTSEGLAASIVHGWEMGSKDGSGGTDEE